MDRSRRAGGCGYVRVPYGEQRRKNGRDSHPQRQSQKYVVESSTLLTLFTILTPTPIIYPNPIAPSTPYPTLFHPPPSSPMPTPKPYPAYSTHIQEVSDEDVHPYQTIFPISPHPHPPKTLPPPPSQTPTTLNPSPYPHPITISTPYPPSPPLSSTCPLLNQVSDPVVLWRES